MPRGVFEGSEKRARRMALAVVAALLGALAVSLVLLAPPASAAVNANNPTVTVTEGSLATNSGAYSSPLSIPLDTIITTNVGSVTKTGTTSGSWSWSFRPDDGPFNSQNVTITATHSGLFSNTTQERVTFRLNVNNVAPVATFNAPDTVSAGSPIELSLTNAADGSSADRTAGFTYAFDCDGDGTFEHTGSSNTATCTAGGSGTQTVKGKISDKDNGSNTYSDTVTVVDEIAPTGSVVINGGAAYTKSAMVSLTLSATDPSPGSDVSEMRFSHDGQVWSDWEAYANTKSWTLLSGNETRTVHAQYKDNADNVSATVQDTIKLDTLKPTISGMTPRHTSITRDTTPTIKATVKDNLTNLQKANIKLYVAGKLISPTKYSYSAATDALVYNSPKLSKGKKTVKIVATDAAGNVGTKSWYFTIR